MRVYRCFEATNEVEKLTSKYRTVWEYVENFERLLSNGFTHGHERYSGLKLQRGDEPAAIWKSKIIYPQLGGKRSGLRYVYERLTIGEDEYAVALTVYIHQSGGRESDVIARIRQRSHSFEATAEGLRRLDRSHTEGLAD